MKNIIKILVVLFFSTACRLSEIPSSILTTLANEFSPQLQADQITPLVATLSTDSPTSTPDPEAEALLYSDDFSDDQSGWDVSDKSENKYSYSDGEYVIEVANNDEYSIATTGSDYTDGVLTLELRHLIGDDESTGGLIFWRYLNEDNFYSMQVNDDGKYSIQRYLNGELVLLTLPKSSPFLKFDGESNKVTVVFRGDEYDIYFNDQFAYHFKDDSITSGSIGMGAYPDSSSNVKVAFDNLAVYQYDPSNAYTPAEPQLTPTPRYHSITWRELTQFLIEDHTNWRNYDVEDYNCLDFAISLVASARQENIDAKIVGVHFDGQEIGHAFVEFETIDRGIVFVEPQGDNTYSNVDIGNNLCDDWGKFECMGIISSIDYYGECDHQQNCTLYLP